MHWGVINQEKSSNARTTTKVKPKQSVKDQDERSAKKGLTPNQKKAIIIGASVVVAGLAIYGGYKLHQSGKLGELSNIGKKKLEASIDEKTGFQKISNWDKIKGADLRHAVSTDAANPGRENLWNKGRQYNCGNTVIANELRQRGLDVTARSNPNGMRLEAMGEFFNGLNDKSFLSMRPDVGIEPARNSMSTKELVSRAETIRSRISNDIVSHYPEGSRGTLFMPMRNSNHFTSWFIDNGVAKFVDPQHPADVDYTAMFGDINTKTYAGKLYDGVKAVRLDNLEVNTDTIRGAVTSRLFDAKDKASAIYDSGVIQGVGFTLKE